VDPERIHGIAEHIVPDDFYRDAHGRLFELLLAMKDSARPTELHAVLERINAGGSRTTSAGSPTSARSATTSRAPRTSSTTRAS
jgi:replicative DNA helicase